MPTRRLLSLVACLLAFGASSTVAAHAAPAPPAPHVGIGIKLLDAPRSLINDPERTPTSSKPQAGSDDHPARARHERHRPAGSPSALCRGASIQNGQFVPAVARSSNELTSWSTLAPSTARSAAGGSVTASVTIHVPADATTGERYATIIADLPPTAKGPGVKVESRVGIRMYLNIVGKGGPRTDFTIDTLTAERDKDGSPSCTQVHNVATVRSTSAVR